MELQRWARYAMWSTKSDHTVNVLELPTSLGVYRKLNGSSSNDEAHTLSFA